MSKPCGREIYPGIWQCKCHRFGAPHVRPGYIEADVLVDRFVAGETVPEIASDYDHICQLVLEHLSEEPGLKWRYRRALRAAA